MPDPSGVVGHLRKVAEKAELEMTGGEPDCPFYGYHLAVLRPGRNGTIALLFARLASGGNQCGARLGEYAPCECEIQGQPIDHRSCAWLKSVTHAAA